MNTPVPGQTYRSNRPTPAGPARIRITEHVPGTVLADAVDADTDASCTVLLADLHTTPPTGDARHDGYTLERTPCHLSTADRWHAPVDPMNAMGDWNDDPGPYTVGERLTCPACGRSATVVRTVTNDRSAGRQYVAHLTGH